MPRVEVVWEPSQATLDRYGLTLDEWYSYISVDEQGYRVCSICRKSPPSGRYVVDHRHVLGWKKMPPEERKKYVRGAVCTTCNHFILTRYGTPDKYRRAAEYLEAYERRQENE